MVIGGAAVCSAEYYLYYKELAAYTRRKFLSTQLPDLPEYQQERVIDTGSRRVVFPHTGGVKAVENVMSDTFNDSRFRRSLGLQFASVYSWALARLKTKRYTALISLGLLAGNSLYLYPTVITSLSLHHLADLVAQGDLRVWANLNEMRFVQRVREAISPELRRSEQAGVAVTAALCMYCAPFVATLTTGVVWVYLSRMK